MLRRLLLRGEGLTMALVGRVGKFPVEGEPGGEPAAMAFGMRGVNLLYLAVRRAL
jgi:hypothetical protein